MEILLIQSFVAGFTLMVVGYLMSRPDPVCHICKHPLPHGYYATTKDGPICKWCAVASGLSPWYED